MKSNVLISFNYIILINIFYEHFANKKAPAKGLEPSTINLKG